MIRKQQGNGLLNGSGEMKTPLPLAKRRKLQCPKARNVRPVVVLRDGVYSQGLFR